MGKVNMAYISKDSKRRVTFKKRTQGLMKKVSEISTLCGVRACAIVYCPNETHPEAIWPPSKDEAASVLSQFKNMGQVEQSQKMMDRDGFLRHEITKLQNHLTKQEAELVICLCLGGRNIGDFIKTHHDAKYLYITIMRKILSLQQQIEGNLPTTIGWSLSASNMMAVSREENLGMNVNVINPIEYGAMEELPDLQPQPNLMFDGAGSSNSSNGNMMMGFGGGELDEIVQHFRSSSSASNMMVVTREENSGTNVNVINPIEYGAMVELPNLQAQPNLMFDDAGPYNWSNGNMMMGFGGGGLDEIVQQFRSSSSASNMMVVTREENPATDVHVVNPIEYGAMVELPDLQVQPNLMFDDAGSNNWVWNNDLSYNWSNGNMMMGFGGGGSDEMMQHFRSLSSTSNTMVVAGEENLGTNNLQAKPNLMFDDAGSSNWLWNNYQPYNSSNGNMMMGFGDDGFDEIMQHFIIEQQESLYPFN